MPRRKKATTKKNEVPWQRQENQTAKIWLWVGVSSLSTVIIFMWGLSASLRLSSFSWDKTPEKNLLTRSQTDWNTLFNNEKTRIQNEQMKMQLKNTLNAIIASTATSTTSTIITTTTPINTTSTTTSST